MTALPSLEALSAARFDTPAILKRLASASRALAELKGVAASIPNQGILINTLGLQEAKDSSEIENIVTTHDELFKDDVLPEAFANPAAKEVLRYRQALHLGYRQVRDTGLITANHIVDIQAELERNNAGFRKLPGTALKTGAGETVYTPPQDPAEIVALMSDLERFINDGERFPVDPLIRMALIHHQFESIHPFYDGNGRTGRILNVLYLVKEGLLDVPVLYLSRHIVRTKADYYRLLQAVRDADAWEEWVLYMLEVVEQTSGQTIRTIHAIKDALFDYKHRIRADYKFYSQDLINNLFMHPYTKIEFIEHDLGVSRLTASKYLDALAAGGFVQKNKIGRSNYYVNVALNRILLVVEMTEDQLEQEALGWLTEAGYETLFGPDIVPDGEHPERADYLQVLLPFRLREAIHRLNPDIPTAAKEDALKQVLDLGIPALLSANRHFHKLLVGGVPVEYQKDGETRGDFVRLIDWSNPAKNRWLAVNQFSIKGPHHTRRPDVILFVNGLPLVLLELKNPADEKADIWKAYDQIQTYKEQIPDVFQYNELLVISDGSEARLGSLSSNAERFMQWRTIDGLTLDPLGQFNELETLIRGVLAPAQLLDYLRFFVLFEDDGGLVKKIAGYHQFHAVRAAINQVVTASRPGGTHKGGVVWHTQGSGKSITMTCFAARVMQETAMENPTIVVITDRNDLDGQLFGVFSLAQDLLREQPVQANTRQDLRAKLSNRPSGGIVFATIQKFMPGEDEDTFPVLSERSNIVVIADEAHRTQYGFEAKLKTIKAPRAAANDAQALKVAEPAAEYQTSFQVGYAQHLRDALSARV